MYFTSLSFLLFFVILFGLYWWVFKNQLKAQNILLLIASYIFYAFADWRFLSLLILSSFVIFYIGKKIEAKKDKERKFWTNAGLLYSIGILFYFKYFNFFVDSFASLLHIKNTFTLNILLPLGISFYTFRMISYLLDIKNKKTQAEKDLLIFFNYIAFFPSMVSGPIDRANLLIPQLKKNRIFDAENAADALRQILIGAMKKLVIANSITPLTQEIFANYGTESGSTILMGAFLFLIEIYADFSGYSDMAIGFAKLLGFKITKNFDFPLFAQNIADYWRRWHISLTTWLTEFLFTPLVIAFRDYGKAGLILAIFINFIVIGIWHGANWTFFMFGFLHGVYYLPLIIGNKLNKRSKFRPNQLFPTFKEAINILITLLIVSFALILFVSSNLSTAMNMYGKIFDLSFFTIPQLPKLKIISFVILIFLIDWMNKGYEHSLSIERLNPWLRRIIYVFLLFMIFIYGVYSSGFIYEQF